MGARLAARRIAGSDDGVTLVELLIVVVTSIVVALALWAIQDLALRQTTRVFARVDATQNARYAMETIENRMHSACVSEGVIPIQSGSTATSLSFISKYGSAARLTPEKHVITLNTNGTLTDATYANTAGTAPNWTFASTPSSTVTLVDNVAAMAGTPVFQYYAYGIARDSSGNAYVDAANNPYVMLLDGSSTLPGGLRTSTGASVPVGTMPANSPSTLPVPLSVANARIAAAVKITMVVGAGGKLGTNTRYPQEPISVSNTVVLRLTPPPADGPLQTVRPCG